MASRFWVGGGSSASWTATAPTNWSASSGGANNASVPTVADDATFNGLGASGNSNVTVPGTATALTLNITSGYSGQFNSSSVLTIAGSVTFGSNMTFAGGGNLTISATATITSNGKTYPGSVTFSGSSSVKTIADNMSIASTLGCNGASMTINTSTGATITCLNLTISSAVSGSCPIVLNGGTWTGTVAISNNLTLQGAVTLSGTSIAYGAGTLTAAVGSNIASMTGALSLPAAGAVLDCSNVTFNNIMFGSNNTSVQLNSTLNSTTVTSTAINLTFTGTAGFNAGTFNCTITQASTITLVHGVAYTITTALSANTSRVGSIVVFTSDDGTATAALTLNNGATCNVLASFTRIDASAGRMIWTFNGTVTTSKNISSFSDAFPPSVGRVFQAAASY